MPAVADETEEEKRLREKEEALLAAQQAALIQPPVMPPEAVQWATPVNTFTSPDLEALRQVNPSAAAQYEAQVAQAQRNSGFINAEVNYEGRVLSPMISPELSPQATAIAEMRARQFTGQQKYRQLIEGGATPEEAIRLAGPDLFYNDTKGLLASIRGTTPRVVRPLAHKPQWGKPTAQVIDRIRSLDEDERAQQALLTRGTVTGSSWSEPLSDEQKAEIKASMKGIREEKQQILAAPENNSRVDLTGIDLNRWNNPQMPQSLRAVPAPVITEQIPGGGFRIGTQTETAAVPAQVEAGTVIKYDKSGKGWVVDERTKKVLRPAD